MHVAIHTWLKLSVMYIHTYIVVAHCTYKLAMFYWHLQCMVICKAFYFTSVFAYCFVILIRLTNLTMITVCIYTIHTKGQWYSYYWYKMFHITIAMYKYLENCKYCIIRMWLSEQNQPISHLQSYHLQVNGL